MRTVRLDKIVVAAVKQSRKPWKPIINQMTTFKEFVSKPRPGYKFIAHCYEEIDKKDFWKQLQNIKGEEDVTILIGPEGDFSIDEVNLAIKNGYESISLGKSRLRTETAGLAAVMMAQLALRK
jgi:16S rRNA (uracil1498-N3)-methyltransferase